jgi:hypothetical protein
LPFDLPAARPLYLRSTKLVAQVTKNSIPWEVSGQLDPVDFNIRSQIKLPLQHSFTSAAFKKNVLLSTAANFTISNIKKNLATYAPAPFKIMPAPFTAMDGSLEVQVATASMEEDHSVLIKSNTAIDLKNQKQVFQMLIGIDVPFDLITNQPGPLLIKLDFQKILLQLPRLSKKSAPPQFMPDGRIKNIPTQRRNKSKEIKTDDEGAGLNMHLQALGQEAMRFRTNLLDEDLRLNFDLLLSAGNLQEGFLRVLPLQTTIFRRPVKVEDLKITFAHPVDPVMEAQIVFPLPEYKIILKLEGPVSRPRHSFSSVPPLSQNDIYAVLLFGRPMADLDQADRTAANQSNQLLSQGILNLAVLYFFAGSPIEHIGYDPQTNRATAQVGLGSRASLRVGGDQEGINSTGIRRSLGKGWYLDTSVQNMTPNNSETRDYGVLLERIIAY